MIVKLKYMLQFWKFIAQQSILMNTIDKPVVTQSFKTGFFTNSLRKRNTFRKLIPKYSNFIFIFNYL
jgi:hypothetical protein